MTARSHTRTARRRRRHNRMRQRRLLRRRYLAGVISHADYHRQLALVAGRPEEPTE